MDNHEELVDEEETECPCGDPSNHDGGDEEGCLEGAIIRLNI